MPRVALLQLRTPATHAEALAHVAPLVRRAAGEGAALVLTPEATNVLQRDRAALLPTLVPLEGDPVVQGLRALAAELGVEVLIGSALVADGAGFANRSVLVDRRGEVVAAYDKIHMFDVDLPARGGHPAESARESATYAPGARARVAPSALGPLGLSVCYDLRFPALYAALARAGAQAIAVPAAFTRPTGEAHWEVLLRARAIETGAWVLAPAQGGLHADGRRTWGRSTVVSPWGEVRARLDHDEPGVLLAEIDVGAVAAARAAVPSLANARTFGAPTATNARAFGAPAAAPA